ncbi:MAG: TonB family protein [Candidatus Riflebacteria bacterium]|nr:TonB family protein [Candidatus Riflebacteria bacterium]
MAWQPDKTAQSIKADFARFVSTLSDIVRTRAERYFGVVSPTAGVAADSRSSETSVANDTQTRNVRLLRVVGNDAGYKSGDFDDENREEFELSLLIHLAFLLFMTAWFAWRGTSGLDRLPKVYPVRLVGPLTEARPGSGIVPRPEPGSRMGIGTSRHLSSGEDVGASRLPGPRHVVPVKHRHPALTSKKAGELGRTGKPVEQTLSTSEPTITSSISSVASNRPPKPYIAAFENDKVSPYSTETTAKTSINPAIGGVDLGEPLPIAMPDDDIKSETAASHPITGGSQNDVRPPSGAAEGVGEIGGGEVEIAGLESLGGGTERFEPPRIVSKVLPDYPDWARRKGISGVAIYKVLVQEAGTVGEVVNLSSTVDQKLAILGAQSMRRWVFTPVLVGGEPKPTWVQITVQFKLN